MDGPNGGCHRQVDFMPFRIGQVTEMSRSHLVTLRGVNPASNNKLILVTFGVVINRRFIHELTLKMSSQFMFRCGRKRNRIKVLPI